ncbi:MAG: YerC/YecD family TrpR-related protein [Clostridia bacterium]
MLEDKVTNEMLNYLYETIASLESAEDCRLLFDDLCTYMEVEQMAQRVVAAKLLLNGKTYAQVIEQTEISSATLSRVSKCVHRGSGGYKKFVK